MEEEKRNLTLNDLDDILQYNHDEFTSDRTYVSRCMPYWLSRLNTPNLKSYLERKDAIVPVEIVSEYYKIHNQFIRDDLSQEYLKDAYVSHLSINTLPKSASIYDEFDYEFRQRAFNFIRDWICAYSSDSYFITITLEFLRACDARGEREFLNLDDYFPLYTRYNFYFASLTNIISILAKWNHRFLETPTNAKNSVLEEIVDIHNFIILLDKCEEYPFLQDILLEEIAQEDSRLNTRRILYDRNDFLSDFFLRFWDTEKAIENFFEDKCIFHDNYLRQFLDKMSTQEIYIFCTTNSTRYRHIVTNRIDFYEFLCRKFKNDPLNLPVDKYCDYFKFYDEDACDRTIEIIFWLASYNIDKHQSPIMTGKLFGFFNEVTNSEIKEIIWGIIHEQMNNPKMELVLLTDLFHQHLKKKQIRRLSNLIIRLIDKYYRGEKPMILTAMCMKRAGSIYRLRAAELLADWNAYNNPAIADMLSLNLDDVSASFKTGGVLVYKKCIGNKILIAELYPDSIIRGKLKYFFNLSSQNSVRYTEKNEECAKYRTNHAKVISIINANDTSITYNYAIAGYDQKTIYKPGDEIIVRNFDMNFEECSTGFHFFRHIEDAIRYNL